jgi:hypothetical protein
LEPENEWWRSRWLVRHVVFVPVGTFIATYLLSLPFGVGIWNNAKDIKIASDVVDLGAVVYTTIAVLTEGSVRMIWWALDQRRKWRAKMREEAKAEVKAEAVAEVLAEVVAEVLTSGRAAANAGETLEEWLERMEEERAKGD